MPDRWLETLKLCSRVAPISPFLRTRTGCGQATLVRFRRGLSSRRTRVGQRPSCSGESKRERLDKRIDMRSASGRNCPTGRARGRPGDRKRPPFFFCQRRFYAPETRVFAALVSPELWTGDLPLPATSV